MKIGSRRNFSPCILCVIVLLVVIIVIVETQKPHWYHFVDESRRYFTDISLPGSCKKSVVGLSCLSHTVQEELTTFHSASTLHTQLPFPVNVQIKRDFLWGCKVWLNGGPEATINKCYLKLRLHYRISSRPWATIGRTTTLAGSITITRARNKHAQGGGKQVRRRGLDARRQQVAACVDHAKAY